MVELSDRSAQGRACGNLGNTHYLLGNFTQAISYHQQVRPLVVTSHRSADVTGTDWVTCRGRGASEES